MEYVEFTRDKVPGWAIGRFCWPLSLESKEAEHLDTWRKSVFAGSTGKLDPGVTYRLPAHLAPGTEPEPTQTKAERLLAEHAKAVETLEAVKLAENRTRGELVDVFGDDMEVDLAMGLVTFGRSHDLSRDEALRLGQWLVDMLGTGE